MERKIKWAFAVPLLALIFATSGHAAGGPDTLWEVTMKMEMPGMPMAMPAQKTQVCAQKDNDEKAVPMDKNCQMLDSKRTGLTTTYSFKCTGDMDMTGKGQVTYAADRNSYQGSMQAKGRSQGQPFEMNQNYSAKRIGNCTYEDPAKKGAAMRADMEARQKQSVDQMCATKGDSLGAWQIYEPGQVCASHRDAFCKHAKALAGEMAEPGKFSQTKSQRSSDDWREGMRRCNVDTDAIQPAACKQANAKRNWKFVADNCEEQAKAIAAKECAGRDYTAAMQSEYGPVCIAYAKGKRKVADGDGKPASVMDSMSDMVKGGLKGRFGF